MTHYKYIKFNEDNSDFILLAPYVRSAGISLDNTCSAIRSFREFLSYENTGVSTGSFNRNIGAAKSLNDLIKDFGASSPIGIRAQDYLDYLGKNRQKMVFICSYGNSFTNFSTDNTNLYSLELAPLYRHSPYVAPKNTIIYYGFSDYNLISNSKGTISSWIHGGSKPYFKKSSLSQDDFIASILEQNKSSLKSFAIDKPEEQKARLKLIITSIVDEWERVAKRKLTTISISSLSGVNQIPNRPQNVNLYDNIWEYKNVKANTKILSTGDGGLYNKDINTDITEIKESSLDFLLLYINSFISKIEELDDKELVITLLAMFEIQVNAISSNRKEDLLEQLLYSEEYDAKNDANILVQFILGMIYVHVLDSYHIKLPNIKDDKIIRDNFYSALDLYFDDEKKCIFRTIINWANNTFSDINLNEDDFIKIKEITTQKWQAMTGMCYEMGRKPEPGDKMAYFDQLIVLSEKQGPFVEHDGAFSIELKELGNLQFGIKQQGNSNKFEPIIYTTAEINRNLKQYTPVKTYETPNFTTQPNKYSNTNNITSTNLKHSQSWLTLPLIWIVSLGGINIAYNLFPVVITKVLTYSVLSKIPLISSLPIIHFIIFATLVTLATSIIKSLICNIAPISPDSFPASSKSIQGNYNASFAKINNKANAQNNYYGIK